MKKKVTVSKIINTMNPTPNNPRQLAGTLIAVFVGLVVTFGVGVPQAHAFSISDIPDAIESGIDWVQDKVDTAEGILATSEETVGTVLEGEQVLDGCQAVQGFEGDAFPGYAPPGEGGGGEDDTQPQSCGSDEDGEYITTSQYCQQACDRLLEDHTFEVTKLREDGSDLDFADRYSYRPDNCQDMSVAHLSDTPNCTPGLYYCKDPDGSQSSQGCFAQPGNAQGEIESCSGYVESTPVPEFQKDDPGTFETEERSTLRDHIPNFERWVVDNAQDEQWEDAETWDSFCRKVMEVDDELMCATPSNVEEVETSLDIPRWENGCFIDFFSQDTEADPVTGGSRTEDQAPDCSDIDIDTLEEELDL